MHPSLTIQLRFFASVREQLGCSEETVVLPAEVATVGQVRQWLIARGGVWAETLAHGRNLRMACEQTMCEESEPVADGQEVAFFPPVTGG